MTTEGTHSLQHSKNVNTSKECPKKSSVPVTVASILKEQGVCDASPANCGLDLSANLANSQSPYGSYHNKVTHKQHERLYHDKHDVPEEFGADDVDGSEVEHFDRGYRAVPPCRGRLTTSVRNRSRWVARHTLLQYVFVKYVKLMHLFTDLRIVFKLQEVWALIT